MNIQYWGIKMFLTSDVHFAPVKCGVIRLSSASTDVARDAF